MHVRSHQDYFDFIYHIPKIMKKGLDNDECENCEYNDNDNTENYKNTEDAKPNYQMRTLESLQYQSALAVTGTWLGVSTNKILGVKHYLSESTAALMGLFIFPSIALLSL